MEPDVAAAFADIDKLRDQSSAESTRTRRSLRNAVLKLHHALEEPGDTVERICFQYMETVSVRIAINLDLFRVLVDCERPQSCKELAGKTGADAILLGESVEPSARILRSLAATGAVGEVEEDGRVTYVASKISKTFTLPPLAAGVEFCFDCLSENWHSLPAYLLEKGYQNPTDPMDTAFHRAYQAKEHFIQFLSSRPDFQRSFQVYLSGFDEGRTSWMDFYPVATELGNEARKTEDAIMFVDVGGGLGHEAILLKKRFPDLPGRFVVQDLSHVVSEVKSDDIEVMVHDFFTPQPLKGARAYYLRNILHDWNDEVCRKILEHIRDAMDPGYSKVLINQWVIPRVNATAFMAYEDLNMMATFGVMERNEQQYHELLDAAGMKIARIYNPVDGISESIIEAVAK